jgi:hypothetical protein
MMPEYIDYTVTLSSASTDKRERDLVETIDEANDEIVLGENKYIVASIEYSVEPYNRMLKKVILAFVGKKND